MSPSIKARRSGLLLSAGRSKKKTKAAHGAKRFAGATEVDITSRATMLLLAGGCSGRTELPAEAASLPAIFVQGVMAAHYECNFQPDENAPKWLSGLLDLSLRERYVATLLVGNTQSGYAGSVSLDSAEVVLTDPDGATVASWIQAASGHIEGGTAGTARWGASSIELIDGKTGAELRQRFPVDPSTGEPSRGARVRLGAHVRVHGVDFEGTELDSPTFTFPIELCYRCLVQYPLDADDPAKTGYQCSAGDPYPYEPPCRLGQDQYVDCRHCLNAHTFCECPTCE